MRSSTFVLTLGVLSSTYAVPLETAVDRQVGLARRKVHLHDDFHEDSFPFSSKHNWIPAKNIPGSSRSPCPLLKTMANHGFLKRDGRNLSMSDFDKALSTALNLDNDFIQSTFTPPQFRLLGILAEGQNHTDQRIDLETLNAHGRNEHGASMSRLGKINGDTIHVHPDLVKKILCDTVPEDYSYLNTSSFGRTRVTRENDSRVAGSGEPDGNITITPGITEGGLPFLFIGEGLGGDAHEMIIRKEMMKEWMNIERIPRGFRRSNRAIDAAVFGSIVQSVKDWREYWSKL